MLWQMVVFGDTVVNLITDDINEFVSSVKDGLGTTVIPYEICTVEKAVKVLSNMGSRLNQRYDLLRRVNQKILSVTMTGLISMIK